MDFVALDVETANSDMASICQIGLVDFHEGQVANSWEWLVDPEDYFNEINVSIHGINETTVLNKPKWPAVHPLIANIIQGRVVVSHTTFDRSSLRRVSEKYRIPADSCTWLDSARVVRRTWPECAQRGYGLADMASKLGIPFQHHNALEDARAAGEILLQAVAHSGISLFDWLSRSQIRMGALDGGADLHREGNPEGRLFGEAVVFTGALSVGRREAADLASEDGCEVLTSVTKRTTLLIVGDQDIKKLAGHEKSSKQRKAEQLIAEGQRIRILGESDFKKLLSD
ncbi:MAG TPA: exonuclease domain-containing protein [Steroidobacteraceae bacterium]|jgi:DNA polymerase-3 subunit epsilon|nr:exonuclease domain-containing protein [Steroidobacteraceae bacterium]